jgi:ADP-ribose pyrophosphatase YjhB (NUDIX family)
MKLLFTKIRLYVMVQLVKFFSRILFIELPPIISVTGIIKKKDKVLFVDLSYLDGFSLPGGVVKEGENLENALEREIMEETGLTIKDCEYLGSVNSYFMGIPTLSVIYSIKAEGRLRGSEEGECMWLKKEDAINNLAYKINKKVLEDYF